jgi:methionyl-tRNA synthetase
LEEAMRFYAQPKIKIAGGYMDKTFYITTPIYYPSDKLHIGHSYTTVAADVMARYKKLRGFDVMFLTGTDEHGQKIERKAKEQGLSPKEYVDRVVEWIKELWSTMDIDYDIFIRTTDAKHEDAVKKIFRKLYEQGDIYKSEYEGWYCTPCETFYTERQLKDGKCPDCGRDVEMVKEESYFFRLSKYQDRLIEHISSNPGFISPHSRQNEMVNNFLKPGLDDLCVSRTSFTWGVPVDFDPGHVVYVWIDALSNYITALGFLSDDDSLYRKYWPADVHLVGKEIVRFHTIIWPAMLMALNEPLPKQVFGHGWLIIDGGKMSKSKGNVVDPRVLVEKYGVDAIRYFLMREVAFGGDGSFSNEALIKRINSDLSNDLGNLLSRTIGMIGRYFSGKIEISRVKSEQEAEIEALCALVVQKVEECMEMFLFSDALSEIWILVRRLNKFADENKPWVLAKEPGKQAELAGVMYVLAEGLRIISILISPFMPSTPDLIRKQLGISNPELFEWESSKAFGALGDDIAVSKGRVIFPRFEVERDLAAAEEKADASADKPLAAQEKKDSQDALPEGIITIEDFSKIKLKVGVVLECEKVKGSEKLLKSRIKVGERTHQIVSGIAKWYSPEDMEGRSVVVAANLKPVKLKGILSEGMLLAAADEQGGLSLVSLDRPIADGSEVR